jgi:hypothetical protein
MNLLAAWFFVGWAPAHQNRFTCGKNPSAALVAVVGGSRPSYLPL